MVEHSAKLGSYFIWDRQGDIPAALNKWMEAIPDGDKDKDKDKDKDAATLDFWRH